jgi:hypothetical protein
LIAAGAGAGGTVRVDGRGRTVADFERGNFLFPTVIDSVAPLGEIARTEIFGQPRRGRASGQYSPLRQHGVSVYLKRRRGAHLSARGRGGKHRDQRGRRRSHGFFSLQRVQRQFFRRPARPGPPRRRVLHADEGRRRALAERVDSAVLTLSGGLDTPNGVDPASDLTATKQSRHAGARRPARARSVRQSPRRQAGIPLPTCRSRD